MLNAARQRVKRSKKTTWRSLRRRANGKFLPVGKTAKRKPPTCRCGAYRFPHAKGGGRCGR